MFKVRIRSCREDFNAACAAVESGPCRPASQARHNSRAAEGAALPR